MQRVVVVGASLAGLRAAETLRNEGFDGSVTVVGAESHRPYDRPPLSKRLLSGEWEPERIALRQPDTFDELDAEWRLGVAATGLDLGRRVVMLDDGSELPYDGLIIATGASCRRLPGQPDDAHVLRTLDDAMRLRAVLSGGGSRIVTVIGAGFIGLEVAATARTLGNAVTVLEMQRAPLATVLGDAVGGAIADLHRAEGVDVRCGVSVERLEADRIVLADGTVAPTDDLVVGIGVTPEVGWLEGSGVELRDGVVCDGTLAVCTVGGEPVPGVYAAGDLVRWPHGLYAEEIRVEHWTNAAEQGALAARNLLATWRDESTETYDAVPFFWSDQYRHRIQFLGRAGPGDEMVTVGGRPGDDRFLALYGRNGRVRGAFGLNSPRWVMAMRRPLMESLSWDDAIAAAHDVTS